MNQREFGNWQRYHSGGKNIQLGVMAYWQDQTGVSWREFLDSEHPQSHRLRWEGVPRMYSRDTWRLIGARWPDERGGQ